MKDRNVFKQALSVVAASAIGICGTATAQDSLPGPIRTYTVLNVEGSAPVMDGVISDGEYGAAEVTGGFVGLRRTDNFNSVAQGEEFGSPNYQWRAVWDKDYLYLAVESESFDIPINGIIPDENGEPTFVDDVNEDDEVYSFAAGIGHSYDIYLEPNWTEGDGFNSNPPDFTESGGNDTDGYHIAIFIIRSDPDFPVIVGNEGIRDENNLEGPPWFFTEGNYENAFIGNTAWNPTFDPAVAAETGALPFVAGISHNFTGAEPASGEVYANIVVEMAIAFSQLNPESSNIPESSADGETNLTLIPDADGNYVNVGDEWLINIAGYTDPYTAESGLTLVTWSDVIGNAFASYPRGVMTFAGSSTTIDDWSLMK